MSAAEDKEYKASLALLDMIENSNWSVKQKILEHQGKQLRMKYEICIANGFEQTAAMYLCIQEWKF